MSAFQDSDQSETQSTPMSIHYQTPSPRTPGTPQTFDSLSYDRLDHLLQRDSDDVIANGLSSCITFARMGVPQLAIAEIPALRTELLTSRWITIAHLEALYEIANSLDMMDLHKLLTDFFIQRGLHLQAAGIARQPKQAAEQVEGSGSSPSMCSDLPTRDSPSQRFKQVRHPLMQSIAEASAAQTDSAGSSEEGSASDGTEVPRKRSTSAQGDLVVMSQNTSPGSPGLSRRRGRNSSPASLSAAVSPDSAEQTMQEAATHAGADVSNDSPCLRGRSRTKSWIVPGGVSAARSISQRTLIRWRQELQVALANIDASVSDVEVLSHADQMALSSRSSGFRIVDVGNSDSPRRRASRTQQAFIDEHTSANQAAFATDQLGQTPASDFLEQSSGPHDDSCPSCCAWQLRYNLLRSETSEQIIQLRNAVEQLGSQFSSSYKALNTGQSTAASPKTAVNPNEGAHTHVVPALQPPPQSARHRSRLSRLTVSSIPEADSSPDLTREDVLPLSAASSESAQAAHDTVPASELHACKHKLKQQKSSYIARETRWKDLTAKLTTRLESKTHEVRALKAQLKSVGNGQPAPGKNA